MVYEEMNEIRDIDEDIKVKEALIEEAKQLDLSEDWNTVAPVIMRLRKRWKQVYYWESAYEDTLAEQFDEVIDAFYAKRNEGFKNIQNAKQELIERAKTLSQSNDFGRATEEMNELMSQWKAAGSVKKEVDDQLWEAFNQARQTFFDRKHQHWQQRQGQAENAKQMKQDLIKQAAELANSTQWNKTSDQFRNLMDQWKAAGFTGKEIDDELWAQFNEHRQKFYHRRSEAYDVLHQEQEEKAKQKQELVNIAVSIAEKKEYTKENTELMKKLNVDWKEIGSCGKEKEDLLWKAFRGAADSYFEGLKQFNEQKHADWVKRMQEIRARKQELIQNQQRQLRWMKNEVTTLLSQSAADEMAEEIEDKELFIQELEADLAEIDKKLGR